MIEAADIDGYVKTLNNCLAGTEIVLNRHDLRLDGLIELDGLLRQIENHIDSLRASNPQDHRLILLNAKCMEFHRRLIDQADSAAKWEREFSGASIH